MLDYADVRQLRYYINNAIHCVEDIRAQKAY